MKKKGTILAGLLLATIVTGYSVAGTYAKYTSAIDMTDEARVAKWTLKATDKNGQLSSENIINLFADSYSTANGTYVKSLGNCKEVEGKQVCDKVVAPGTEGSYAFTLGGTIETKYSLEFIINEANDYVVYYGETADGKLVIGKTADLDAKTITPMNEDGTVGTATAVTAVKEYRPLRYTIEYTHAKPAGWTADKYKNDTDNGDGTVTTTTANVDAKTLKNGLKATEYNPGEVNKSYKITWKWDAENAIDNATDKNSIAKKADEKVYEALVNKLDTFAGRYLSSDMVTFNIKVVATQVTDTVNATDPDNN